MVFHEGLTIERESEEVTEMAGFHLNQTVIVKGNYRLDLKRGTSATVNGFDPERGLIHIALFKPDYEWSQGHWVQPDQIDPMPEIRSPHKND